MGVRVHKIGLFEYLISKNFTDGDVKEIFNEKCITNYVDFSQLRDVNLVLKIQLMLYFIRYLSLKSMF